MTGEEFKEQIWDRLVAPGGPFELRKDVSLVRSVYYWQSIDTAPKDGEPVDLWAPANDPYEEEPMASKRWVNCVWTECWGCVDGLDVFCWYSPMEERRVINPTHWMRVGGTV